MRHLLRCARVVLPALLLPLLLAGCHEAPAPGPSGADLGRLAAQLDRRVPALMEAYAVPGASIALVQGGSIVWSRAYGLADVTRGIPMHLDATFRTESISKAVTAWGVMRLVEAGRIALDDPIGQHLTSWTFPDSEYSWADVTVRRLLNHTAGLPPGRIGAEYEYSPRDAHPTLAESLYDEARLIQPPGKSYVYSNPGYGLLELMIEDVTGQDFAGYMARNVLGPLGMSRSSFTWSQDFESTIPTGYDLQGRPVPVYVYAGAASGGLFATVQDMAAFVAAELGDPASAQPATLGPAGLAELHEPGRIDGLYALVADGYGLGHFIDQLDGGARAVWVGGQGHGWMSDFHTVPEAGAGIVILTNSQRSWPLIAEILQEWTAAIGASGVGFARIGAAVSVLWLVIGGLFAVAIGRTAWLLHGLVSGRRRLVRPSAVSRGSLIQGVLAVTLATVVGWAATRDYLFLMAVFPMVSDRLWLGVLALAAALALGAVLPRHHDPGAAG